MVLKCKIFRFLGLKTLKKVKNSQKTQKIRYMAFYMALLMVKFDFS